MQIHPNSSIQTSFHTHKKDKLTMNNLGISISALIVVDYGNLNLTSLSE